MSLTKAQRRVLEHAVRDGGAIEIGGIDATVPRVRRDVALRLHHLGYLKWDPPASLFAEGFAITEEGRSALVTERVR
jgi:hypothetical protein